MVCCGCCKQIWVLLMFFVWVGCCMHKELNAVKGGDKCMTAWWDKNGIDGPLLLMNQDNTAAASGGSSDARSHAIQISGQGAVKALNLTGALFCNKDDKKGQQDALQYYLEALLGYFSLWPDMSNTRYQSHCNTASEWLVHHSLYITYLEILMHRKDSQTFTNMEWNVYNTLLCPKTTEEIVCLSLWGNCIGPPVSVPLIYE
ncbi:hypothetical protein HYDPIDRAFT_168196 [Hydnomerulius pinastri MD-312]|uniref:Uncharacterized protein n=1 Tax=Hydnomerulius pinastri MD-312 TaxID=994086 RepID=A0A0C9VDY1_9AGAM|nr:hypothetical protein HYDPIDRAFT_168196 [Hydnomerulius pinastri MD-312]